MATGTTYTTDKFYCNAGIQTLTIEPGLTYLIEDRQYVKFTHNQIMVKGWLKSYNEQTGILEVDVDFYNGGGGDNYENWTVEFIDNFKHLTIDYLTTLKNSNVIVDGECISSNEELETSVAKASFIVGEEIKQKFIIVYKNNNNLEWKFYTPSDSVTTFDFSTSGWHYPAFEKRIVAPIALANQYPSIEVWFRLNNLPIYVENGTVYLYCNTILPEHQTMANALQGVITIENRVI